MGHLVLYVSNLDRSRRFYSEILGWIEITTRGDQGVVFSSGRTHHELLLLEVGPNATPIPGGLRLGMYHFGLKIGESDDDLRKALKRLEDENVPILGKSDHGVTHSLYILDPDGNEIELYIDVQPPVWQNDPKVISAPIRPLNL